MQLLYLIYDGINNTVFANQVWQPLISQSIANPSLKIHLISFEREIPKHNYYHSQIKISCIQRSGYYGRLSLWQILLKTKQLTPSEPFKIIARGPFAGWVALRLNRPNCHSIIIQARGLAAAEYAYSQNTTTIFQKIISSIRHYQFKKLEQAVYSANNPRVIFECVSEALQTYLIKNFQSPSKQIIIAKLDLPKLVDQAQVQTWRTAKRTELKIAPHSTVYCYSGSTHKWQCPDLVINFFKNQVDRDPQAILLILCPQPKIFETLVQQANIPNECYRILAVEPAKIYEYLAAANYGLLFREPHILNWVSRPTKALEYQAVGLKILHNNTIEWLTIQN